MNAPATCWEDVYRTQTARITELERENAALKQRIFDDNKAYGCEIRDAGGTIWDHAQKLQKENAALRMQIEDLLEANERITRMYSDKLDRLLKEKEAQP